MMNGLIEDDRSQGPRLEIATLRGRFDERKFRNAWQTRGRENRNPTVLVFINGYTANAGRLPRPLPPSAPRDAKCRSETREFTTSA